MFKKDMNTCCMLYLDYIGVNVEDEMSDIFFFLRNRYFLYK